MLENRIFTLNFMGFLLVGWMFVSHSCCITTSLCCSLNVRQPLAGVRLSSYIFKILYFFFKKKCLSHLNRRLQRESFISLFHPIIVSSISDSVSPQRLNPAVTMADSRGANEPGATTPETTDGDQQVGSSMTQDHEQTTDFLIFFFFFCDSECRCPCEQPPVGQLRLWGRVQILHQHQRELAFAERSDGCGRERRSDPGSSGQHRVQASDGHHRTTA